VAAEKQRDREDAERKNNDAQRYAATVFAARRKYNSHERGQQRPGDQLEAFLRA